MRFQEHTDVYKENISSIRVFCSYLNHKKHILVRFMLQTRKSPWLGVSPNHNRQIEANKAITYDLASIASLYNSLCL